MKKENKTKNEQRANKKANIEQNYAKVERTDSTNEALQVKVVDMIMGSGKTEAAITYMNSSAHSHKFIYITPYLKEVERIKKKCPGKHFIEPLSMGKTKLHNIKELIRSGRNIATTHALFQLFDNEIVELIANQNYTLILDEVVNVIENYHIMQQDLDILLENFVTVDSEGYLHWRDDQANYIGEKFQKEKQLCSTGSLKLFGDNALMWLLPVTRFTAFKEVIILTYMFDGQIQKYYYDLFNINYEPLYVSHSSYGYRFTTDIDKRTNTITNYGELITIIDNDKMNDIGSYMYTLSKSWYIKNEELFSQFKAHIYNFFHNSKIIINEETGKTGVPKSKDTIWTTFKDYRKPLKGNGYAKGFVPLNTRATNEYQGRTVIAYLVNRYCNPLIKKFFSTQGIEIDEDEYALSEMLQFIWRSGIRQGKHITVYIPSLRMRELLKEWIREQDKESGNKCKSMRKYM